jgi:hypothetical protein
LNPIEHLWDLLKNKIDGLEIHTQRELDEALIDAWDSISIATINNYHSSFRARLQICAKYNGNCPNGKWKEVKELHHASE